MSSIIFGVVLIGASAGAFWYLLPRNGQEHPLVKNSGVGSMVTLVIMSILTIGVVLLFNGFVG